MGAHRDDEEIAAMLIGASEGQQWRYEVLACAHGYLVQVRDLATRAIEQHEQLLFRTALAAFAYAELSAIAERAADAHIAGESSAELLIELGQRRAAFLEVAQHLSDNGEAVDLPAAAEADEVWRLRWRH